MAGESGRTEKELVEKRLQSALGEYRKHQIITKGDVRAILRSTGTEELRGLEERMRSEEESGRSVMTHEQFLSVLSSVGVAENAEERDLVLIYAIRQSDTFLEIEYQFMYALIGEVLRERGVSVPASVASPKESARAPTQT